MLAKIREKTHGIIATFVLALVGIPFILWGIGSYFERGAAVPVAKVNGINITQQAYRQRLEAYRTRNPQIAENPAFKNLIVESLVDEALVVASIDASGYRMSDARLLQTIHEIPDFQLNGVFSPPAYDAWLRSQRFSPAEYETRLRNVHVAAQLERGLSESAFVTPADLATAVRLLKQERRVSYAFVNADTFMPKVAITPAEIEEHYQVNQDSFRTQEAVRVEYVTLKASDIGRDVQPTEEELRQAYASDAARYVVPEKRRVSRILIETRTGSDGDADKVAQQRLDDISQQLKRGVDFAALAKKYSDDKESAAKGGDLGEIKPGKLPAEVMAAIQTLKPGEVSQPIRTNYGYHLLKLTAYQPEQRRSYEAAKPELMEQVRRRKAEERFFELSERFRNLVYEHSEGLQPAAKELGLTIQTSDWFTRNGGPGIAAQSRIAATAFEPEVLSRERNTDVLDLDAETLVALHVIEHRPSTVRPLAEVRPVIERTLKEQRAREQARTTAEEWVQKLEQGTRLNDLAKGAAVQTKTITREQTAGLDKRLVDAVFTTARPKDKPVPGQADLGRQGYAVYALESVKDADPASADAASKEKVRRQLLQRHGADLYVDYRTGLRKAADVRINNDQL